ncbi:MAG: CPBP family intramembrane metalloprotease [Anaerolineae bacterium]|nr:CPBP family intramembrane metalloprotease [Anaerolineae bacterium]
MRDGRVTLGGVEFDVRLSLLIVYCTVVPMLDFYNHSPTDVKAWDRFIFYFIGSALFIWIVYREPLANFGFGLGDRRRGAVYTLVSCAAMAAVLWFAARTPAMQSYYKTDALGRAIWLNGVELFAWEFVWRGLALFAFARAFGPGAAIFLQAMPFAFMHLSKPELEALSTIFGGAAFGFIAWRTRSFVYPWLIHWFVTAFTLLVAAGVM